MMENGARESRSDGRKAVRHRVSTVGIMVRDELRIVVAALAIFAALAGMAVSIHGMLYYESNIVLDGVIAMGVGIAAFVLMLTVHPKDIEQHRHRES
jgi:hypothetical protein